ncbi:MAG: serine hydrolase [Spirochaetes bacterium]|jgi:CubicO group peptidase (beta-lactamase class C family)|nr:serine hydrolase [Spirochaetota bacterium]
MSRAAFLSFLAFILLLVAAGPAIGPAFGQEAASLDDDERAAIDSYMAEMLDTHRIPGMALAVVRDGAVAYTAGYGTSGLPAEVGSARAMLPDTPVRIGSATASFTALTLVQLAERGNIELDAPVSDYLSAFAKIDEQTEQPVTVRHLLSHTSGIPPAAALWAEDTAGVERADEDGAGGPGANTPVRRLAAAIAAAVARRGTEAEPGVGFTYADANLIVAGAVLEAATGRPYSDYLQQELLDPLGLEECVVVWGSERAARGHARGLFDITVPIDAEVAPGEEPAAGLACSAGAAGRYIAALLAGASGDAPGRDGDAADRRGDAAVEAITPPGPLSPGMLAELWRPQVEAHGPGVPDGASYAHGWLVEGSGASRRVWHAGTIATSQSAYHLYPGEESGVFVAMNVNGLMLYDLTNVIARGVHDILRGEEPPAFAPLETARSTRVIVTVVSSLSLLWLLFSINAFKLRQRRGALPVKGKRDMKRGVAFPLLVDGAILIFFLVAVPAGFNARFTDLLAMALDIFMLSILAAAPVGVWAAARTVLSFITRDKVG